MKHDDKDLFFSLYKKYYHALLFTGLKEVRNSSIVKDNIQQLFLSFWEKRSSIISAGNIKSYLVNTFLEKFNIDREKFGLKADLERIFGLQTRDLKPGLEELITSKGQKTNSEQLLTDRLDALTARQMEMMVMRFYEGLSYEEIIEKTGLTKGIVNDRIYEGLKKLKLDMLS